MRPSDLQQSSDQEITAEVVEYKMGDGTIAYFVHFETPNYHGSRGVGLSLAAAEDLAEKIRSGEVKP